ncbi:hypothetical protein [Francisella sp. XLW-1]|uniref:hypothetical protein n=1 Tax=Francisella TaxID=262 RepID=UPI00123D8CDA|nr:hypothetical protein [Francisella sp. XLW-1]
MRKNILKKVAVASILFVPFLGCAAANFEVQVSDGLADELYFGNASSIDPNCKVLSISSKQKVVVSCDGSGQATFPVISVNEDREVAVIKMNNPWYASASTSLIIDETNESSKCDMDGNCTSTPVNDYYLLAQGLDGSRPDYADENAIIKLRKL